MAIIIQRNLHRVGEIISSAIHKATDLRRDIERVMSRAHITWVYNRENLLFSAERTFLYDSAESFDWNLNRPNKNNVIIPPICGPISYMVALHEVGHIMTTPAHQFSRHDRDNSYQAVISDEINAWDWAFAHMKCDLTKSIQNLRDVCLETYEVNNQLKGMRNLSYGCRGNESSLQQHQSSPPSVTPEELVAKCFMLGKQIDQMIIDERKF